MHSNARFVAGLLLATTCSLPLTMTSVASTLPADNPFARESALPYQLPPLDRIRNEHFAPGA